MSREVSDRQKQSLDSFVRLVMHPSVGPLEKSSFKEEAELYFFNDAFPISTAKHLSREVRALYVLTCIEQMLTNKSLSAHQEEAYQACLGTK